LIHDLDRTIESLLYNKGNLPRNDVDVAFDTPDRDWASRLSRPTLNCWAFDLRENMKLRNMERQVTRNGNMTSTTYPSLRYDVSYLITAWARKMEDEHQLLWRALAALRGHPIIQPNEAEGSLRYSRYDLRFLIASNHPDHPVNLVDLWGVLDNVMHLGFTLVATLELDVIPTFEAPMVFEQRRKVGIAEDPASGVIDSNLSDTTNKIKPPEGKEPPPERKK
jgi:hypothetical protein